MEKLVQQDAVWQIWEMGRYNRMQKFYGEHAEIQDICFSRHIVHEPEFWQEQKRLFYVFLSESIIHFEEQTGDEVISVLLAGSCDNKLMSIHRFRRSLHPADEILFDLSSDPKFRNLSVVENDRGAVELQAYINDLYFQGFFYLLNHSNHESWKALENESDDKKQAFINNQLFSMDASRKNILSDISEKLIWNKIYQNVGQYW